MMTARRHTWKRWEAWENPAEDPETTFDDLMIEHKGHGFGIMWCEDKEENKKLQDAIAQSRINCAKRLGLTEEEFKELEMEQIKLQFFGSEA